MAKVTPKQKTSITRVFKNLQDAIDTAITPKEVKPTAEYTIDLIVKRTRLGYGVSRQFGSKEKLKDLSQNYIDYRSVLRASNFLSSLTTPKRSNLTLTGQMLASMGIVKQTNGRISIGPTGNRFDTRQSNAEIAAKQERMGRIFNRVSSLEYQQIVRFYRRSFGDLLRRKRLLK